MSLESCLLAAFNAVGVDVKALQAALATKVDKVAGKQLSTEDYTSAEKTKLAGIANNANNYSHPNSGVSAGTYKSITVNAQGHVTAGSNPTTISGYGITDAAPLSHVGSTGNAHGVATTSVAGFMSAADKQKLGGIAAGAQVNTVTSVADKTGAVTLAKADVGLGSVDNTSDANKPISTATRTALDATVKRLDVGASPAQVPAGQHLGKLAYMDELAALRATLTQPQAIGAVWVERVSDTSIKLFMRGNDGVARSTTLTLS